MATTRSPESLAVGAAKRVLQQIEGLQYRMRDDNQFASQLAPAIDDLAGLRGAITALGAVLSNADLLHRLRAANPEPVEFAGETAHSYLEAVFKAGERLFVTCSMLVRHGVEYPFQSRLNGDVNEGENGLWPPMPGLEGVEYSPGHGGCLRDAWTLYRRIRGVIKALPTISAERGAVVVEKEILRAGAGDSPIGANYCPNEAEQAIIDAIGAATVRLTTEQVFAALTIDGIEPNRSQTKASLAVLVRAQILDNDKDAHGRGYGLRSWTV